MDPQTHDELERRCPHCGAWQPGGEGSSRCHFCDGELAGGIPHRGRYPVLNGLIKVAQAYRRWSLGVFVLALIELLRTGGVESFFFGFLVLVPFGTALGISFQEGPRLPHGSSPFSRWWTLESILAPAHQILPGLNMFPAIPRTQNRILSWYFVVYVTLQLVVAPPVVFGRSLRTAWRGGKPALASWICVFGFLVWGLFLSIVLLGVIVKWAQ